MRELTYIYLIRHSEQLKIRNKIIENEKIILSVEGERISKKWSC